MSDNPGMGTKFGRIGLFVLVLGRIESLTSVSKNEPKLVKKRQFEP